MPALLTPRKLQDSTRAGEARLAPFRRRRNEAVQEYGGRFWIDDDQPRPLNLIDRAVSVFTPYIAARSPQHEVTSRYLPFRGQAIKDAVKLDLASEQARREKISRGVLFDAFMSPRGIARVGLRVGDEAVTINDRHLYRGQLYMRRVDLDDWCCDPAGRCSEEWWWEREVFRIPRSLCLESGLYRGHEDRINRLPSVAETYAFAGDMRNEDMTRTGSNADDYALGDLIELAEYAIYDEDVTYLVTLPAYDDAGGEFLRERQYQGHGRSPFHHLEFYPVSNHPHGVPPVAKWREQAETYNKIITKAVKEILAAKMMLVGPRESEDDLIAARDASDSEVQTFDNPEHVKNVQVGAMLPDLMPMASVFLENFNIQAGNPDLMGGQKGNTDKATIYAGMQQTASTLVDDLSHLHDSFQTDVSRAWHFHIRNDEFMDDTLPYRLPGGEWIELRYTREQMRGSAEQFTVKIKPRSMQRMDPNTYVARLGQMLQVGMESAQMTVTTSGAWRTDSVLRILGNKLGIEELDELYQDPMLQMQLDAAYGGVQPLGPGQPAGMTPGINPQGASYRTRPASDGMGEEPAPGRGSSPRPPRIAAQPAFAGAM